MSRKGASTQSTQSSLRPRGSCRLHAERRSLGLRGLYLYSRSGVFTASGAPVRNPAAYAATGAPTFTGGGRPISDAVAYSDAVMASRAAARARRYTTAPPVAAKNGWIRSGPHQCMLGLHVTTDRSKAVSLQRNTGRRARHCWTCSIWKCRRVDATGARRGVCRNCLAKEQRHGLRPAWRGRRTARALCEGSSEGQATVPN